LPDRRFRAFLPEPNPPTTVDYRRLMDLRFRRSGDHVYLPMCQDCTACEPIRVAVAGFQPRADQRRIWKRNADLTVTFAERGFDAERAALYRRYQETVHGKADDNDAGGFLVTDGGIPGGELHARDAAGTLVAVSVIDLVGDALSSVYCYYDPDLRRRGLGTYMALAEIAFAQQAGLVWLYLGFYVAGCAKMTYKARFGPAEVMRDGAWQDFTIDEPQACAWGSGHHGDAFVDEQPLVTAP
jgi:arginine-tRNA-protein transferase